MPQDMWSPDELTSRRDALRQAAAAPSGDPRTLLEAALAELDAAIDYLALATDGPSKAAPDGSIGERRLLRAAFQEAPVALFLLDRDGIVRRANVAAGDLVGAPPGYATGKPLTTFIDLPSRAALQSHLAAAARTDKPQQVPCRVIGANGPVDATLSVRVISLPGDPKLLIVSAGPAQAPAARKQPARRPTIQAMARRMDTITALTRLLLDNSTFSEGVTLQRCARLLAEQVASWVIVDVDRAGTLRRQVTIGPQDEVARVVRAIDPQPGTLSDQVHANGKPVLLAHAEDPGLLGTDPDGTPVLMLLDSTSLICVPVFDGDTRYGTLTLACTAEEGRFVVADLALAEELGQHMGVALRVDRMFQRRSEVAQALQASLLPSRLPDIPGLELAASYVAATRWQEISGDFYDVFQTQDRTQAWGIMIGDVCGKGEEAAAMTAAARHAMRAIGHHNPDPIAVLHTVNDVLYAADYGERFVTADLAFLHHADDGWSVRLGNCGHPGPALLHADGRVEVIEGHGLPLGIFQDADASMAELTLEDGDLLLFYTDGVTGTGPGNFEDRLTDQLTAMAGRSAAETVRAVQGLVTEFSDGEFLDDVTMAAVKAVAKPVP
jgi:serine phosphatase RsbU (regulator of sigma subunit)/PAS domain-containing protein